MVKGKRHKHSKKKQDGEKDQKELKNGVDVGWHKDKNFCEGLKRFHDKYARQPDRTKVNVIEQVLLAELEKSLSSKVARVKIEYTGSSFEGTKVPKADDDPDFEFDMLFLIEGGDQLKKAVDLDPDIPGFVYLEPRDVNTNKHCFEKYLVKIDDNKRNVLSAANFLSDFHAVLAECIREIGELRRTMETDVHTDYLIKLRRHGPAIQMDVYLDNVPIAAVGDEVLGEQGQTDLCDEVIQGATGDDNMQSYHRMENNCKGGHEAHKGEDRISKESDRSQDQIENSDEDAVEEVILETREEADATSDQDISEESSKRNCKEVCLKFRLAAKGVNGKKELSKLKRMYSVDVVPTLHVPSVDHNPEGEYYVAKPVKGQKDRAEELKSAWRRSHSLEAKKMLKFADKDNTCKKMVFRILKAIKNRECGIAKMNTYHLKNALLKELDAPSYINEGGKDWSVNALADRFIDVLERLIKEYASGQKMSEYFISEIDLLEHMKESTRENIHCRLKRLRNSKTKMMRILEGSKRRKRRPQKKQANTKQANFYVMSV